MRILYGDLLRLLEHRRIYCQVRVGLGHKPDLVEIESGYRSVNQGDLRWVPMEISLESVTYFKLLTSGGKKKNQLLWNHIIEVGVATARVEEKTYYAGLTLVWEDVNPETGKLEEHVVHCGNVI